MPNEIHGWQNMELISRATGFFSRQHRIERRIKFSLLFNSRWENLIHNFVFSNIKHQSTDQGRLSVRERAVQSFCFLERFSHRIIVSINFNFVKLYLQDYEIMFVEVEQLHLVGFTFAFCHSISPFDHFRIHLWSFDEYCKSKENSLRKIIDWFRCWLVYKNMSTIISVAKKKWLISMLVSMNIK